MGNGSEKRHILLVAWASVATAVLLLLVIGGCVYLYDIKLDCHEVRPCK